MQHSNTAGCILLKFYIKPQHTANVYNLLYVVSYRNSTSNHNTLRRFLPAIRVVFIEILHQTTTSGLTRQIKRCCILSKFYIKPQLQMYTIYFTFRCILSKFYIKPQLQMYTIYFTFRCILSKFYIKPQLVLEALLLPPCCILSKFYIKPQLMMTTREGSMRCILSKFYIKPQPGILSPC